MAGDRNTAALRDRVILIETQLVNLMLIARQVAKGEIEVTTGGWGWLEGQLFEIKCSFGEVMNEVTSQLDQGVAALEAADRLLRRRDGGSTFPTPPSPEPPSPVEVVRTSASPNIPKDPLELTLFSNTRALQTRDGKVVPITVTHIRPHLIGNDGRGSAS